MSRKRRRREVFPFAAPATMIVYDFCGDIFEKDCRRWW